VGSTGRSSGIHLHFQIDNSAPSQHPFFPNRFDQVNDATSEINTPDNDGLVADRTFSPLIFVQQYLQPTAWLSFVEGDPGIPGDGIFINARPIFPDESGFQLSTPFPLGTLTDGFTVTVFFPFDPGDLHSLMLYFVIPNRTGSCTITFPGIGFGGDLAPVSGQIFYNGVVGYFINFPQSTIQQVVNNANYVRPGCNLTVNDLFLGGISLQRGYYQYITVLDAAAILPGQNVVPTDN